MSVVIVGGNERMANQYETICKEHGFKAKVFTKENGSLRKKMGYPDLLILFISTVSHKLAWKYFGLRTGRRRLPRSKRGVCFAVRFPGRRSWRASFQSGTPSSGKRGFS